MEWDQKKIFIVNTNLVFLLWISSLLLMIIVSKLDEKTQVRGRKFPGINIKEF